MLAPPCVILKKIALKLQSFERKGPNRGKLTSILDTRLGADPGSALPGGSRLGDLRGGGRESIDEWDPIVPHRGVGGSRHRERRGRWR